jgi:hypothetical protein
MVFLLSTFYLKMWQLFLGAIITEITMPIHILHPDINVTIILKPVM